MRTSFTSPMSLIECPQLTVVAVLETAVEMTLETFRRLYPNLCGERNFFLVGNEEDAYADAIMQQLCALQRMLQSYRVTAEDNAEFESAED